MRKLASIQRVLEVHPIPNADRIECVTILGWKCVVRKDEFKAGDLVVYIEIDSLLPFNPWTNEDLSAAPMRLKTVKMKGQISQGLVLSTKIPQLTTISTSLEEGQDITDVLGITKYEPPPLPAILAGNARGNFPSFLVKTDELRVQACPSVITRCAEGDYPMVATEKLDGSSTTYYLCNDEGTFRFGACSRNLDLLPGEGAQWTVAAALNIEAALRQEQQSTGRFLALQGELVGPGIQGNKLQLPAATWFAFNLWDITSRKFLNHGELVEWCVQSNIPHVPVVFPEFRLKGYTVDALLEAVQRRSLLNPSVWIEGLVVRSLEERRDPEIGRLSFKAINQEWLLAYKE